MPIRKQVGSIVRRSAAGSMLVLCFAAVCTAQRYTFKEYTEGLSNLNVRSMLQDRTGFLWIGTENGVLRYDGARFKEFGRIQGLSGTWVLAMHLDQSGRLWVGTDGGLFYLSEQELFINIHFQGRPIRLLPGSTISSDAGGSVLAISDDGLLKLTRAGGSDWNCRLFVANDSLPATARDLTSVLVSGSGSIYAGCGTGLCEVSDNRAVPLSQRSGLPAANWNTLYEDHSGRIWLRGLSHVATLSPSGRIEVHDLPRSASGQLLPQFAEDAQGKVITGLNNSIARFEHGRWRVFSRANGLAEVPVESVFVDREGSLWIAYMGHGLRKWLGYGRWEHWTSEDGLNANSVWAILRDHMGRLWIGDEDGIAVQDASSQKFKPWQVQRADLTGVVSLAESKGGSIWIGTVSGRLVQLNPGSSGTREFRFPKRIKRVFADSADRLWVATLEGLFRSDPGEGERRFSRVEHAAAPDSDFVDFSESRAGEVWIGERNSLIRFDGSNYHRIEISDKLGGSVYEIARDANGDFWADGAFEGVARLRIVRDRVVHIDKFSSPPLVSGSEVFVRNDRRGRIWIGGDHGINRFDGYAWTAETQDSGLLWNDINEQAFYADRDGTIWIGTSGGLSHLIHPESGTLPPPAPRFMWTDFGPLNVTADAALKWTPDPLEIGLAALTFKNEKAVHFRYRLSGADNDWVNTTESKVRYAQLTPGKYRFEVQSVDRSTGKSSEISTLPFRILPPWWQSWLFQFVLLCAVLALVVVLWRWRVASLMSKRRELEALVLQRTRELDEKLT